MSSDTGGFKFRDYGDTQRLADRLLAKTGKTAKELLSMIQPEPQADKYMRIYATHHTVIPARDGLPTVAYQYLRPEETILTEPTDNPNFCHQITLRQAFGPMRKRADSQIQFIFAPINESVKGTMVAAEDRYKIEFRRSAGEILDLSDVARRLEGGGHKGASGATITLTPEQLSYIDMHKLEPKFNKMDYIAGIVLDIIKQSRYFQSHL